MTTGNHWLTQFWVLNKIETENLSVNTGRRPEVIEILAHPMALFPSTISWIISFCSATELSVPWNSKNKVGFTSSPFQGSQSCLHAWPLSSSINPQSCWWIIIASNNRIIVKQFDTGDGNIVLKGFYRTLNSIIDFRKLTDCRCNDLGLWMELECYF